MKTLLGNNLILLMILASSAQLLTACKKLGYPLPPASYTLAQVEDSWVGFSDRNETYYLLTLDRGDRGELVSQPLGRPTECIKVIQWGLNGYSLQISLDPANSNRISHISCFIKPDSLEALMEGTTGWKEDLVLRRQGVLTERLTRLSHSDEMGGKRGIGGVQSDRKPDH